MTTPEQPATPPLTRKKMREIRNTGSTPIINADTPVENSDDDTANAPAVIDAPPAVAPVALATMPRAATPAPVTPPPVADATVDLGVSPLTRRQARQQERIRTASVPVITPDVAAAHAPHPAPIVSDVPDEEALSVTFGGEAPPAADLSFEPADFEDAASGEVTADNEGWRDTVIEQTPETAVLSAGLVAAEDARLDAPAFESEPERAVVSPLLGADLLSSEPSDAGLPSSFDQLLSRSTGALATSNALIMADAPSSAGLVGAMSGTGEIMVTGSFQLPEGLGSTGHARGTTDGKDVDAVLIDGELPPHSSPTPIAASAAISTVKAAGEVIQPPAPEKGSRLMMTLAITAGVLALALVGVLIIAFATGVFS